MVGFLVVMEFGSGMLQGWYPPLLGAIGTEFGVSPAELNWVVAAYLLASVVFVPTIGKLGDRYGHKRLLTITAATVALGSITVATAPTFGLLLVGRVLEAPLTATLALEFAIVRDRDEKSAGRSIGKLVSALTLGAAFGGLGSGLAFGVFNALRPTLWVPAVFLLLCVPIVWFLVPESNVRTEGRIDWIGAGLLSLGLVSVLTGIANAATWGWTNPVTWALVAVGAAVLVVWVLAERRISHPLVDIGVLVQRGIGLPLVIAFIFGAQLFGSQTASSVYMLSDPDVMGFGLGVTPAAVGTFVLAQAGAAFVSALNGFRLAGRIGSRSTVAVGGVLVAASYVMLILAPASLVGFYAAWAVRGLGNGLVISVLPAIIVKRAPADSVGIASALYTTSRTAAGAVAGAVFALVMSSFLMTVGTGAGATTTTSFTGYLAVWGICAGLGLVVAILALVIREPVEAVRLTAA
ncbi:MFS transporter [Microbacterium pumilum]|uniref:MFS transporter n=1 Tax=Microbacterium pumilum TaxID=344165 RepID=A0ABN2S2Q9_9MICO